MNARDAFDGFDVWQAQDGSVATMQLAGAEVVRPTRSLPMWECERGHWTEKGERPAGCMAQDDEYGPGLCGLPMEYSPKVGDVFYCSWGYDQTNVDFYEVVGVTKSGKSVRVQACRSEMVDDNGPATHVVPVAGSVWGSDGVQTKRLRTHYRDGTPCTPAFFVASYADAYLWDGAAKYETGQGWGH